MINYKFIQTKWLIVGAREGSESFLLDDVAEAFLGIFFNPSLVQEDPASSLTDSTHKNVSQLLIFRSCFKLKK